MKIRRYFGYDCDSVMGFNDGRFIDDHDGIEVKDLNAAIESCAEFLMRQYGVDRGAITVDESTELPSVEYVTGYYDKDGGSLTFARFSDGESEDAYWRYVFVNFEIVEEQKAGAK
jgi:hypothetical protein